MLIYSNIKINVCLKLNFNETEDTIFVFPQSRENVLNQLKEVTGVEDVHILKQALEASRNESGTYDITQAVNFLVDENAIRYNKVCQ